MTDEELLREINIALGGAQAWVAGGWVRDRVLGRSSKDLDIVVSGPVATVGRGVGRLARHLDARAHLIGREPRSVWRIVAAGREIEFWALADLSLSQDIERRDLSCNALMFALPEGPVIDRVGGLDDIKARRLVGLAAANFEQDPVRVLRVCRFTAELPDFEIEERTASWMESFAPKLAEVPRERLGKDLWSLVRAKDPARGCREMIRFGVVAPIAPGSQIREDWQARLAGIAGIVSRARSPLREPRKVRRIALLAAFILTWSRPPRRQLHCYAWPAEILDKAWTAAAQFDRGCQLLKRQTGRSDLGERRQFLAETGEASPVLIELGVANARWSGDAVRPWTRLAKLWRRNRDLLVDPRPLLKTEEVAALAGLEAGPALGRVLAALRQAQIRGEIRSASGARRRIRELNGEDRT